MNVCFHPDAVTELISVPGRVRYSRTTAAPVMGMIRRVHIAPYEFLERRCPDCRARVAVVVHDPSMRYRVDLAPSLIPDASDIGAPAGTEWSP